MEGDIDAQVDGVQDIKILFPFQNFSLHLTLKAHPVFKNRAANTAGYRYDELNSRQTSLLQYVVKSYVTGQIIQEGDLIAVATRDNRSPVRESGISNDNYTRKKLTRILAVSAIGLVFLASAALFASSIYENSAIVKSYLGIVQGEVFTVRNPVSGTFHSLLAEGAEQVTKDQAIASVQLGSIPAAPSANAAKAPPPQDNREIVIKSPCDCLIVNSYAQDGEFRVLGDSLFELLPLDSPTWVTASLRPDQIHRIQLLDNVNVRIVNETNFMEGNVSSFEQPRLETEIPKVRIKTKEPIPPQFIGRMAYVEFIVN